LTVTDNNGNSSTCNAIVTVVDDIFPVALCQDISVTLSGGVATIAPQDIDNGSYDNCGIVSRSLSKSTFTCEDIGTISVILTVTDPSGNISSCTANVTVVGIIPSCAITAVPGTGPYTGGPPTTIYLGYGPQNVTLDATPGGGTGFIYSWSPSSGLSCTSCQDPVFTPTVEGNYTFTLTVENEYGCSSTCSITICVMDIRVPGTNGKKVYLCHVPPGNTQNPQTLSISVNAVPAHIPGHPNDHLGKCDQSCENLKIGGETGDLIVTSFSTVVYPNPFTSEFNITVETVSSEPIIVKIFDLTGRMMEEIKDVSSDTPVTAGADLNEGLYLLKIQQGDQVQYVKIIKRR